MFFSKTKYAHFSKETLSISQPKNVIYMSQKYHLHLVSVTRRSRSDESHSLTYLLTYSLSVLIDFTDVTLVSDDTYRRLY